MEEHVNDIYPELCPHNIMKSLFHDYISLATISPELHNRLWEKRKKVQRRIHNDRLAEAWFAFGKQRNILLQEVLAIMNDLKLGKISITEESIKSRLSKMPCNEDFWHVVRIAFYELDLMTYE